MFAEDKDDEPATVMVGTESGRRYDVNNLSGAAKARLVMEGEMEPDSMLAPANMPGKKLKELRARHNSSIQDSITKITEGMTNPFSKGDFVEYHKYVTEVLDTDAVKGVLVRKREGGKKWIHHSKVKAVEPKDE